MELFLGRIAQELSKVRGCIGTIMGTNEYCCSVKRNCRLKARQQLNVYHIKSEEKVFKVLQLYTDLLWFVQKPIIYLVNKKNKYNK